MTLAALGETSGLPPLLQLPRRPQRLLRAPSSLGISHKRAKFTMIWVAREGITVGCRAQLTLLERWPPTPWLNRDPALSSHYLKVRIPTLCNRYRSSPTVRPAETPSRRVRELAWPVGSGVRPSPRWFVAQGGPEVARGLLMLILSRRYDHY